MMIARHLSIHGRVQGVFYRGWAVEKARELGLAGWVRNRGDGTVEAIVQGDADLVARFIAFAESGPAAAHVERIEAIDIATDDSLDRFSQYPTI